MISVVSGTKAWLQKNCILVRDDWLQACVDWILEENQDRQPSQAQINDMVYEQWLLADLHELETQCLPESLLSSPKYQLSGSFALQIDSIVDIGQSYYSQLQKRKGTENANALVTAEDITAKPWEAKPSRMLMIKLTDGKQTVQGMEYRRINSLSVDTPPGTKIVVVGEVLCRHAVLMLTEKNIRILGGEVDTLMEANTQVQMLKSSMDSSTGNAGKKHRQELEGSGVVSKKMATSNQTSQNRYDRKPVIKSEVLTQPGRNGSFSAYRTSFPEKKQVAVRAPPQTKQVKDQEEWDDDNTDYYDAFIDDMDMNDFEDPAPPSNTGSSSTSSAGRSKTPTRVPAVNNYGMAQETLNRNGGINSSTGHVKVKRELTSGALLSPNVNTAVGKSNIQRSSKTECDNTFDDLDEFDDDFDYSVLDRISTVQTVKSTASPVNQQRQSNLNKITNVKLSSTPGSSKVDTQRSSVSSMSTNRIKPSRKLSEDDDADHQPAKLCKSSDSEACRVVGSGTAVCKKSQEFPIIKSTSTAKAAAALNTSPSSLQNQDTVNTYPFTYLSQVLGNQGTTPRIYTVKAYITTLTSKLTIISTGWSLSAKISDGSAVIDVNLSSGVLNQLIGFSSQDAQVMKTQAKKDAAIRELLTDGIQQCQQKLINLSCLMEVQLAPPPDTPLVMSICPVTSHHVESLYNRVTAGLSQ